ncbi:cuticle collagen 2-like [Phyllostomus hastatus]|uniref:cuticle collagen 2-like n=1 Tax=Phyllostomus hastatus TaxID=9423 RepID=UPI001E6859C0|nr:cuticle collagen 2-like [Phyllostomus hastatus]
MSRQAVTTALPHPRPLVLHTDTRGGQPRPHFCLRQSLSGSERHTVTEWGGGGGPSRAERAEGQALGSNSSLQPSDLGEESAEGPGEPGGALRGGDPLRLRGAQVREPRGAPANLNSVRPVEASPGPGGGVFQNRKNPAHRPFDGGPGSPHRALGLAWGRPADSVPWLKNVPAPQRRPGRPGPAGPQRDGLLATSPAQPLDPQPMPPAAARPADPAGRPGLSPALRRLLGRLRPGPPAVGARASRVSLAKAAPSRP